MAAIARQHIELLNSKNRFNLLLYPLPQNLAGGCGTSSLHLLNLANKNGLHPTLVAGHFYLEKSNNGQGHYWIEYCGFVIDITATQFIPCDKVFSIPLWNAKNIYQPVFKTKEFEAAQKRTASFAVYPQELKELV